VSRDEPAIRHSTALGEKLPLTPVAHPALSEAGRLVWGKKNKVPWRPVAGWSQRSGEFFQVQNFLNFFPTSQGHFLHLFSALGRKLAMSFSPFKPRWFEIVKF
jgi:hypothetical protein